MSRSGSNQPELIPVCSEQTIVPVNAKAKKKRKQQQGKKSYALI
jgi:predicted N-formylglutamate amidohydrolase